MSADQEIFLAYGLYQTGLSKNQIQEKINYLGKIKKTYTILYTVLFSDRTPNTIVREANKIGMFIPLSKRYGINAFYFFINNINYYEDVLDKEHTRYPSHEDIVRTSNKYQLLSSFTDEEIIKHGKCSIFNYNDRKEMLNKYIFDNYTSLGQFSIDSNSRRIYSYNYPLITYTDGKEKIHYSIIDLIDSYNHQLNIIYKKPGVPFHQLSLLQLRQIILEKLSKWKDRSGYTTTYEKDTNIIPISEHELKILINYIDCSIPHLNKPDSKNYLDTPKTLPS